VAGTRPDRRAGDGVAELEAVRAVRADHGHGLAVRRRHADARHPRDDQPLLARRHVPEAEAAVVAGDQRLAVRREGQVPHPVLVSRQTRAFLAGGRIEEGEIIGVGAAHREGPVIRGEGQAIDLLDRQRQGHSTPGRLHIPQAEPVALLDHGEDGAVPLEGDDVNRAGQRRQAAPVLARGKLPEDDRAAAAHGGRRLPVGGKGLGGVTRGLVGELVAHDLPAGRHLPDLKHPGRRPRSQPFAVRREEQAAGRLTSRRQPPQRLARDHVPEDDVLLMAGRRDDLAVRGVRRRRQRVAVPKAPRPEPGQRPRRQRVAVGIDLAGRLRLRSRRGRRHRPERRHEGQPAHRSVLPSPARGSRGTRGRTHRRRKDNGPSSPRSPAPVKEKPGERSPALSQ
jgi:hypothetical protein